MDQLTGEKLTGREAIEYARSHDLLLSKYADPTEGARNFLLLDEAEEILREDPGLIWVEVRESPSEACCMTRRLELIGKALRANPDSAVEIALNDLPMLRGALKARVAMLVSEARRDAKLSCSLIETHARAILCEKCQAEAEARTERR